MTRPASSYRSARRNAARAERKLAGWPVAGYALAAERLRTGDKNLEALRRVPSAAVKAGAGFLTRGAKKIASRPWLPNTWGSFFKIARRKARARAS